MNIDVVGKFYLGNGGIGDALLFLSTFYDDIEEANVIFLANEPNSIKELLDSFPKIKKKLVIQNDFHWLREFYAHPNCIGTGILPKNLDYSTWHKIDPFKTYGVKEFPEFMNLFPPKRIEDRKQMFVQFQGSSVEGHKKRRILAEPALRETQALRETGNFAYVGGSDDEYRHRPLAETISLIRGSDVVISVDSFAKTVSAMSGIRTIVYDNIYDPEYLKPMGNLEWGHYIFIYGFRYIELRQQQGYENPQHQKEYERYKKERTVRGAQKGY